jgi:hypothetical protein
MILPVYLVRKFFKAFIICTMSSYSIFFIFSLMGNLGEKLSFKSIFLLSILNSFQIFTYIPSHLFILSLCLFVFNLKSKNELIIIKEYIDLKKLFLIIFPILVLFIFTEIKKDNLSNVIEQIKSNVINSKKIDDTKIIILFEGNKKKYTIVKGYDLDSLVINQYLSFESQNSKINRAEISNNLHLKGNDLFSNESVVYEKNNFQYENFDKKLVENFIRFWAENAGIKFYHKNNNIASIYYIIQSILFICLFYICISMIFLSKKLVDRGMNIIQFFLILIAIFLYFLLVPKIILSNFQYLFQLIAIIIFILIFFKIKHYE